MARLKIGAPLESYTALAYVDEELPYMAMPPGEAISKNVVLILGKVD